MPTWKARDGVRSSKASEAQNRAGIQDRNDIKGKAAVRVGCKRLAPLKNCGKAEATQITKPILILPIGRNGLQLSQCFG